MKYETKCPNCSGSGEVDVPLYLRTPVLCGMCEGTGKLIWEE